jgi:hypothetical protein
MTKLEELEKVSRQAWLVTIGTYAKGWEILSNKVNETFEDTNKLINELVESGEKIETDFKTKIRSNAQLDSKILALKAKLGVEENVDDRLALLNKKVDQLSIIIEKLAKAKAADLAEVKAISEKSPVLTEKVAAVKKAPVKRSAPKEVSAKTEATPAAKPARARRTTAKTKTADVK